MNSPPQAAGYLAERLKTYAASSGELDAEEIQSCPDGATCRTSASAMSNAGFRGRTAKRLAMYYMVHSYRYDGDLAHSEFTYLAKSTYTSSRKTPSQMHSLEPVMNFA